MDISAFLCSPRVNLILVVLVIVTLDALLLD